MNITVPTQQEGAHPRQRFPFYFTKRARYHEIDAQGVVYNAHYLTYFDMAITEFARARNWLAVVGGDHDFHVVNAEVNYKKPIRYDQKIDICVKLSRVGRSSVQFDIEIHGEALDDLRAHGTVTWVWADQKTGMPHPVPDKFIQALQS